MAKKLAYERYYWLHGQIRAGQYPNARKMAEVFEISQKQAQRDIEFMRDRLHAPLVYQAASGGYAYEEPGYDLPPVWLQEEELLALSLALRLSAAIPDRKLKDALHQILQKFLTFRSVDFTAGLKDIREKISVKNTQYYRVDENLFHRVMGALFKDQSVKITYYTPHKMETTERVILPLHLLCYMGSWHLIAFCTLRGALRDFALSRIRTISDAPEKIAMPELHQSIRDYIRRHFGLIAGKDSIEVCLRFTPEVSGWVSEQIWHATQEVSPNTDGSLHLRFPVSDFQEVRREILRYGAGVEVIAPETLREEIREEIRRMSRVYR